MRSLYIVLSLYVFFAPNSFSKSRKKVKQKYTQILYYKNTFGHIHRNPSRYSTSLTTISCGHPLRKIDGKKKLDPRWTYISAGPYKGHILTKFVSTKRVKCFSDVHSKFFDKMNLSITDMYYFGRLYDQYIIGKTRQP